MKGLWTTKDGRLWLIQDEEKTYLGTSVGIDEINLDEGFTLRAVMPCHQRLLDAENGCRFEIHDPECSFPSVYDENSIMISMSNCRFKRGIIKNPIALDSFNDEIMYAVFEIEADIEVRSPEK